MQKLLILSLMGFLLTSCGFGTNPATPTQTITPTTTETSTPDGAPIAKGTYENDLKSVSDKIKDSNEFKSCMDMQVPMCIQSAGMQIAQRTKSADICAELSSQTDRESCVFTVTLVNAQEKNDTTLCKTLSWTYADQCNNAIIRSQASTAHNPKLCNSLMTASGDTNEKDQCILNTIMSGTGTRTEDCGLIQETNLRTMCTDMIKNRP